AEGERGHDPEVPAAPAQTPEEIRVLRRAGRQHATVGGHDLGLEHVVARETALALQPAAPAAERQARDAGGGEAAARHGEPELLSGLVELAPGEPRLRLHDLRIGV